MMQRDGERRSALDGYTGERRYVLDNSKHHKHAEMLVRVVCHKDGSKQFEVVSSTGWGGARKYVFSRLLDAETDASRPGGSDNGRVSPTNYSFRMLGTEQVNGRPAYVIEVAPKSGIEIPDTGEPSGLMPKTSRSFACRASQPGTRRSGSGAFGSLTPTRSAESSGFLQPTLR